MTRQGLTRALVFLTVAVAAGCEAEPEVAAPPGASESPVVGSSTDDEVNLESMLTVVGAADIRHGTGAYQAPDDAPVGERGERVFVAFLSSGQEVPAVRSKAEGAMALILDKRQERLRYVLQHEVEGATAGHLHLGAAGENGPVAVALPSLARTSVGVLTITPAQAAALLAGRVYVNLHSPAHPGGEIRGQILRPGETAFVASLRGTEEVPVVTSAATAQASLILSANRDRMRYRVTFAGLVPTVAHVHREIAGVNGPVVKPLAAATVGETVIEGSFAVNAGDVQDLALRQWYLNLHTAAFPAGELRGQILRPGEVVFAAALSGAAEVPAVTSDRTGNAMVVLGAAGAKLLYVASTNAAATAGHIHRAPAGMNGPVELALDPVGSRMSGILDLGEARRADIEAGLWYVNLHTAANPSGELRGQLARPGQASVAPATTSAPAAPAIHAH